MRRENLRNNRMYILSKLLLVFLLLTLILLNTKYGFILPKGIKTCVYDATFNWTDSLNSFFKNNQILKNIMLILSSILLDSIFVYFLYVLVIQITTLRPLIALFFYISCKLFCQVIHL